MRFSELLPADVRVFLDRYGDPWVEVPLRILLITLGGLLLRRMTVRLINRVVTQVTAVDHDRPADRKSRLGVFENGLLANERRRQRAETIGAVLRSVASFTILGIAFVTVLGELGLDLGPIIASAGIVGVAVGFGAQNLVKDFLSGIFMILEDQYGVGDTIDVGEASGTVEDVGLRITRVRDINGVVWYVRNGEILRVGNKSQGWARALVDVPVAYAEDLPRVQELIKTTAAALADDPDFDDAVLEAPDVAGVESLNGDTIVIRVMIKTVPGQQADIARELRARLKATFDKEGVQVTAPALPPAIGPTRPPLV